MPSPELQDYDFKILSHTNDRLLYRGLFGWPSGSIIRPLRIKHLIDHGYVEFVYDWGKDRPALKITALGRCRYNEYLERDMWRAA
jgi:hypothetical protein